MKLFKREPERTKVQVIFQAYSDEKEALSAYAASVGKTMTDVILDALSSYMEDKVTNSVQVKDITSTEGLARTMAEDVPGSSQKGGNVVRRKRA